MIHKRKINADARIYNNACVYGKAQIYGGDKLGNVSETLWSSFREKKLKKLLLNVLIAISTILIIVGGAIAMYFFLINGHHVMIFIKNIGIYN